MKINILPPFGGFVEVEEYMCVRGTVFLYGCEFSFFSSTTIYITYRKK